MDGLRIESQETILHVERQFPAHRCPPCHGPSPTLPPPCSGARSAQAFDLQSTRERASGPRASLANHTTALERAFEVRHFAGFISSIATPLIEVGAESQSPGLNGSPCACASPPSRSSGDDSPRVAVEDTGEPP